MKQLGGGYQSPETEYAGLPKACKLVNNITALGAAAVVAAMLFDTVAFNYGDYTFTKTGAFYTGISIPTPGVYSFGAQMATLANTQTTVMGVRQNGNQVFRDGSFHAAGEGQAHGTAGTVSEEVHGIAEFQSGDILDGYWASPVGGPVNGTIGGFWLYIKKEEGR